MTNTSEHKHTNRLINESSPYLLQHAHNPVNWYPWGKEALEKSKTADKPIFVSIGYSACHWCHRLEEESFEDEETAAMMNELFVNIKVDREERPDLDSIYMDAVQAMTGSGGWPMSVFLTPDGQPFYGGTYYPPEPRYGMPSFRQVLASVADAWQKRREQVLGQASRMTEALRRTSQLAAGDGEVTSALLKEATDQLNQYFDDQYGGFGSQPKFPQPMTLDFAMRQYKRTGDLDALFMAEHTLTQMAQGGIYDHLGGGFHRYSVDAHWLVPHFEKMLYDNAQLLRTYLQAWKIAKSSVTSNQTPDSGLQSPLALYQRVIEETIAYVLREMTAPEGGFYSTQDADSEGHEGKFFVWTPDEIESIVGDAHVAAIYESYYGVSKRGNFESKNILNVVTTIEEVAKRFRIAPTEVETALATAHIKLFIAREKRIKPGRDEKVLVEWNGLMIHALTECAVAMHRPDWLTAATNAATFILSHMSQPDGKLYRSYKSSPPINTDEHGSDSSTITDHESRITSPARFNAYLEDYAAFARALIALYEATFNLRWLAEASRLTQIMFEQFHDKINGGFYQTGIDHEQLVVRRKDTIDNAVPSGNSLAAETLLRLAVLVGNDNYRKEATRIIASMKAAAARQPTGFGRLLCAIDTLLAKPQEVAIVGDPDDPATQTLLNEVHSRFLPNTVLALRRPNEETMLPLLESRTLVDGKPAAYVCEQYVCKLPVTSALELGKLLG